MVEGLGLQCSIRSRLTAAGGTATVDSRPSEGISDQTSNQNRRVFHATCTQHGGAVGFTHLAIRKSADGSIEFDPHVTRGCVIRIAKDETRALCEVLAERISWPLTVTLDLQAAGGDVRRLVIQSTGAGQAQVAEYPAP